MGLPEKTSPSRLSQNHNETKPHYQTLSTPSINTENEVTLYNDLIRQNNTTEEVVKIGGMIQESIRKTLEKQTSTQTVTEVTPANHTGNWKTSLLFNTSRLLAHLFSTTVQPVRPSFRPYTERTTPTSAARYTNSTQTTNDAIFPTGSTSVSQKGKSNLDKTEKPLQKLLFRKKRAAADQSGAEVSKYDLTDKNVVEKLGLTSEEIKSCPKAINNLKKAINRYNKMEDKNSREGQGLLVKQAEFLDQIKKKLKLSDTHPFSKVMVKIKHEYKSHRVDVEKLFHGIWVAGSPPEGTDAYIKTFLKAYDDFDFYLWVDGSAYGAAKFSSLMKRNAFDVAISKLRESIPKSDQDFISRYDEIRIKYDATKDPKLQKQYLEDIQRMRAAYFSLSKNVKDTFNALLLKETVVQQDRFFNFCLLKGLGSISDETRIEFLSQEMNLPQEEIAAYRKLIEDNKRKVQQLIDKVNTDLQRTRVYIKDIKELNAMSNKINQYNYNMEMLLRWNYAAATDQARMYMLYELGGIYTDLDMMPAYSSDINKQIHDIGGDSFFEDLSTRRAISGITLKLVNEERQSLSLQDIAQEVDLSKIPKDNQEKLPELIEKLKSFASSHDSKDFFDRMASSVVRDTMPILQRYHKWSTGWNVRGLNGLMMSHKGSYTVEAVIRAQQQAYEQQKTLRQNVLSQEFFSSLQELSELDAMAVVGGELVKDYLGGSLFYDFRQDSIMPGAVSTLGISGPDLITQTIKNFFREQGPIGQDFLESKGRKLGKDVFLGAYQEKLKEGFKEKSGPDSITFDWLHPLSVGANDVTPADDSTWCGIKNREAGDLLFSDPAKINTKPLKFVSRTTVNIQEFTKSWSEKAKSVCSEDLLQQFNTIITSSVFDVGEISELDVKLTLAKQQLSDDKMAYEGIFSLQVQLAELVRSTQFPVSNSISFILDMHSSFEKDLDKAVKLYLKADPQTTINLWTSSLGNRALFLKDMIAISERTLAISNFIDSLDESPLSQTEMALLTTYSELKAKESLDLLTLDENDKFLEVTTKISEKAILQKKINEIEYYISSGYLYRHHEQLLKSYLRLSENDFKKKTLAFVKDLSNDKSLTKQDQKNQNSWYDKICDEIYQRRVAGPESKVQAFKEKFKDNNRVLVRDMDAYLSGHPLFERMQKDGYAFQDFQTLGQLFLANSGVSGVLSTQPVFPAPSKLLVDVVRSELKDDYDGMHEAIPYVYDYLVSEKRGEEGKKIYEHLKNAGLEMLGEVLSPYTPQKLLAPPSDNSVTAFGRRYGMEDGREIDQTMVNLASGMFNPAGYTMGRYLEALYEIHRDIQAGTLTEEKVQSVLRDSDATCFINTKGIQDLIQYSGGQYYCSLTEVHRILTDQYSLAEATSSLLAGAFPGISQVVNADQKLNRPRITTITEPTAVNVYDYRGVGLDKDIFFTPHDIPPITYIVEGVKYTAESWGEFFNTHIERWSDLAARLGSKSIETHPQTFLYEVEGRCMGLSMLYMLAEDAESYRLTQDNLMAVSSLYQENKRDGLSLSESDQKLVDRSTTLIDWLQLRGNKFLSRGEAFSAENWSVLTLKELFEKKSTVSVLITTPNHSMVLQKLGIDIYRLTDPNFGHVDFDSVDQAFYFVGGMMEESVEIRNRYGLSDAKSVKDQIKIYIPKNLLFKNSLLSGTDLGLTSRHLPTTLEKMTDRGSVSVNKIETSWRILFQIGGTVDHKRVSESTKEEDLSRLKIDGDVLNDYLSKNALDADTSSLIQTLLRTNGLEPGTKPVRGRAIIDAPNEVVALIQTSKRRMAKMKASLQAMRRLIAEKLKSVSITDKDQAKIKSTRIDDKDQLIVEIETADKKFKTITFDGKGLAASFRKVGRMLDEVSRTGVLDLDLGMSVLSLVQYARMVEQGQSADALANFNLILDAKATAELTLGSAIQAMGKNFLTDSGINAFSLESALAARLQSTAHKIGGSAGRALLGAARVLELPILETVAGVWNLYSSISSLTQETSHSERVAAGVQVAFDTISLALTLSAVAAPSLMLAAGPVAAIGMGAASIARNVAYHESRHDTWLKYKAFLDQSSENVVVSIPERGVIDLSGNGALGNVCLDLRENPPKLTGDRSYNANRWIGHHPKLSDREVRELLSYAYSISPERALAKGHANSYWPKEVPKIPPGKYHTVIVGYGIQYKAVTEVVYLSNRVVWREAVMEADSRYYQPPLTAVSKQTTIIAGEDPLTVLPVRLLDEDPTEDETFRDGKDKEDGNAKDGDDKEKEDEKKLDTRQKRIEQAESYKDYKIIVKGGSGGVVVQVGGAGFYDLIGDPKANNAISFRAIPKPYSVTFDLRQGEQQVKMMDDKYNIFTILTIRHYGFNTVMGSASGYDAFYGDQDTRFFLGAGGGAVYSGAGKCQYDVQSVLVNTLIFLDESSTQHIVTLHQSVFDIKVQPQIEQKDILFMALLLFILPKNAVSKIVRGLYIGYPLDQSTSDYARWVDKVIVLLDDGIELRAMKAEGESLVFGAASCDHSKWQKAYPEVSGYPEEILASLKDLNIPLNKEFTIIRQDSLVVFDVENQTLTYHPNPYAQISVRASSEYNVVVSGEEGCSYIIKSLPGIASKEITIQLKGSLSIGAVLDFYSLVVSSIEGRLPLDSNNTMELIISSPRYNIPIKLTWPDEVPRSTFIEVTDKVHGNLGKWYDILKKNRGETHTLYRHSMLVTDRIESVRSLDDAVTLLESKEDGDSPIHILGVENKEDAELRIVGKMHSGTFMGSMENSKWAISSPSERFNVTVPPRNIKYLSFQRGPKSENVVFYSELESPILEAKKQPETLVSRDQWRSCSRIDVYTTSLILGNFVRYRVSEETDGLSRQLMYAQDLVKIHGRDLIVTLFYIRGGQGVGSVTINFKVFFNTSIKEKLDLRKDLDDQIPLINPEYRDHLELTLGSEKLNLAILASEFLSAHHVTNLQQHKNVPYRLEFPHDTLRFPDTNIFAYTINPNATNTSSNDFKWLPIDTSIKKYELPGLAVRGASFYTDPLTGDLFLTRITRFGPKGTEALLIKFPNYKCKWQEFQKMMVLERNLLTILNRETLSMSGVTFSGPAIQRIRFDYMNWMRRYSSKVGIISIETGLNSKNDPVMHFDLIEGGKYRSFEDLNAWDLRDRFKQSMRARTYDDYLLKESLHLCEKEQQWKVPEEILEESSGYYSQISSTWVQEQLKKDMRLTLPANSKMALITSQGVMFTKRQERSGYVVHYKVVGLNNVANNIDLIQTSGAMLCTTKSNVTMVVKHVDNSQYNSRNIFVVTEIVPEEKKNSEEKKKN
ncbi:LifA/Efa1-related large cytotoxin [Chlamydiifrater phoenicopteri]|uniref:LifA/Efa1-related large cytotoxin n=1 Tax=Chlamydiifrater phoenicopteri TaxID=2681469 RepID=UPI001BCBF881|nr:LifA/Efa1-related large cytotoxin [Chlamydiifrater phoenicopteri]